MGEDLEIQNGRFYIQVGDGGYVPFDGIPEVRVTGSRVDNEENHVYDVLNPEESFERTLKLTHKQRRFWKKFFHCQFNKEKRRIRYLKRLKEYDRRRKLKSAKYI